MVTDQDRVLACKHMDATATHSMSGASGSASRLSMKKRHSSCLVRVVVCRG